MAFEKAFAIDIPNEAAEKLQTVGDVTDYVVAALAARGRPRSREAVGAIVRVITCERAGTTLDKLTDATSFVNDLRMD